MPARGLFGVSPYRPLYREGSTTFRTPQPAPQPPRVQFLSTPDPQPAIYQSTPSRDASIYIPLNREIDISRFTIRQFFDTDIPYPTYRTVITMIRGVTTVAAGPPPTPPAQPFLFTDPPSLASRLRSDDRIFPPIFGLYDPLASGAFLMAPTPWKWQAPAIDTNLFIPSVPVPPVTIPEQQRIFMTLLSYQSPYLQDASMLVLPTRLFAGEGTPLPIERYKFFTHEYAWKWSSNPNYPFDASRTVPPIGSDRIVIPTTSTPRPVGAIMRRRQLLGIRPWG